MALTNNASEYPVYFFKSETSGEKLYEEFYTEEEELDMDTFTSVGVIKNAPKRSKEELDMIVADLITMFQKPTTKADIVTVLNKLLPQFAHIETGMNLDQKM